MAFDFRALQVRTNKLIASGSTGRNALLLIYPVAASSDLAGGINASAFPATGIGTDVFMFVSGASGDKDGSSPTVTVFGGDVHVSGTLSTALPIDFDTDWTLTGSTVFTTSSVMVGKTTKVTEEGTDVFMFVSGNIGSKDTATRGLTAFGGDIHISGTITSDNTVFGSTSSVDWDGNNQYTNAPTITALGPTDTILVEDASANFAKKEITVANFISSSVAPPQFSLRTTVVTATDSAYDAAFGETVRVDNVNGSVQVNLPTGTSADAGKQVKVVNQWTLNTNFGSDVVRDLSQLKAVQNVGNDQFTTIKSSTDNIGDNQRNGTDASIYEMRWNAESIVFEWDGVGNWILT